MVCTLSKQYNLKSLLHYRFHIEKDKGDAALCTQYNAVLVFWQQFDISQTYKWFHAHTRFASQILVQQKDVQMFNSSSEDTQKAQFPTYEMVALCILLPHDFLDRLPLNQISLNYSASFSTFSDIEDIKWITLAATRFCKLWMSWLLRTGSFER